MNVKIGCCGFPVAKEKYFGNFGVVEIEQTFYQPPRLVTAEKWAEEAPGDFEFALKAWQLITHPPSSPTYRRLKVQVRPAQRTRYGFFRPTDEVFKAWKETDLIASALNAKIIVFQCPASFTPQRIHIENLTEFFRKVERKDYIFVWEPRGGWPEKTVSDLCEQLNLIHCVDPFKEKPRFGKLKYFRLHGIDGYKYKYTDTDLNRLKDFCVGEDRAYAMFNNAAMWEDAERFKQLL